MARKRKQMPEPTREQKLTELVNQVLTCDQITPMQMYNLILMGSQVYKPGMGIPQSHVWEAILQAFRQNGRCYMNPYQVAVMSGRAHPEESDYHSLNH
jgi:hypothetical protein